MAKNSFSKDPRRGDDRNLVLVDQDFGQPDLEDRMWLFWLRNKTVILAFIAAVILGILGWICWHAYKDFSISAMQEEYQKIGDKPDEKLFFARAHAGQPLAGIAALEAGDLFFKEKNYASAAGAYAEAQTSFSPENAFQSAYAGRALLGEAFSRINGNEAEKGVEALKKLAQTATYPGAERGQAFYALAQISLEKKDIAGARKWIEALGRELDGNNPWNYKVQELLLAEPELSKPETAEVALPIAPAPASTPVPPAEQNPAK